MKYTILTNIDILAKYPNILFINEQTYINIIKHNKSPNKLENLIIYYYTNTNNEIIKFIELLKSYPPPHYTYIYLYNKESNYISNDYIKKLINVNKFINIIKTDKFYDYARYTKNNINYVHMPNLYDFSFFINRYMPESCGKGRLLQGKLHNCWLISAINGFILNKKLNTLVINLLNIDTTFLKSSHYFIKKLLYNILILRKYISYDNKNEQLNYLLTDYIYYSKCYSFHKDIKNKTCNPVLGILAVIQDLYSTNINSILYIKDIIRTNLNNKFNKFDNNITQFIINIEQAENYVYKKHIIINNIKFILCFAIIYIYVFKDMKQEQISHVMTCYKCNKHYFIYDSSYGSNLELDWRNSNNINLFGFYNYKFEFIQMYSVYIKDQRRAL